MSFTKTLSAESKNAFLFREGMIVILMSILIGLCSQIAVPLPFNPVPMVFQNILILFLSIFLGSRRTFAAVLCFLTQSAVGLPVLALGKGGLLMFIEPTGGYLVGYLIAAFMTGFIVEKIQKKTLPVALLALLAGSGIIFATGAAYLSTFVGIKQAILIGIVPFLIGDLFKIVAALKLLQWTGWNKSSCR